jgi:hypothetical protein
MKLNATQHYIANLVIEAWAKDIQSENDNDKRYVQAIEFVAEYHGIDLSQLRDALLNNELEETFMEAQLLKECISDCKEAIRIGEEALENITSALSSCNK